MAQHAQWEVLLSGFPGSSSRGFLGWSSVTLVRGPSSTVLFDTGTIGDRAGLMSGLMNMGLSVFDIDVVVVSHLHFDHLGNSELFPEARTIVGSAEIEYAGAANGVDHAISGALLKTLLSNGVDTISGEVAIDSGVTVFETPGHTPGHIALRVETPGATVVAAGDALKNRHEARAGVGADPHRADDSRGSIANILSLADVVIPGHDECLTIEKDGSVTPWVRYPLSPMSELPDG